jgi:hypothetical protein
MLCEKNAILSDSFKSIVARERISWPELIGHNAEEIVLAQFLRAVRIAEIDKLEKATLRFPELSEERDYHLTLIGLVRIRLSHYTTASWWIAQRERHIIDHFLAVKI